MNIHMILRLIFTGTVLVLSMLTPMIIHAACVQSDLKGTWITYSVGVDTSGSLLPNTNRCKIRINSSGSIVASKSFCNMRISSGILDFDITGGGMKVKSSCDFNGTIKVNTGSRGIISIKLQYGTLASDKRTFSAVLYDTTDISFASHMTAVKK